MRVVIIEPGQVAEIREIEPGLKSLQTLVGGYIECLHFENDICLIVNEEGKIHNLPSNRICFHGDRLVGSVIIVNTSGEDFCSLTEKEAEDYKWKFLNTKMVVNI